MPGAFVYQVPPGWPLPEPGWEPPNGWKPPQSWPPAPPGWVFWRPVGAVAGQPAPPASADLETQALRERAAALERELGDACSRLAQVESQLQSAQRQAVVQASTPSDNESLNDMGIYTYRHPLETSVEYRDEIAALSEQIKDSARTGQAVLASDMFTYNNSLAKGRKMTGDLAKLMLRAYNAEADNAMRTMRAGNLQAAVRRLESSAETIARLASMMEIRINPDYHSLRVRELEMTQDFLMKLQEEKERAREERERLREERKVEQELRAERERLDKERTHYLNVLRALQAAGDPAASDLANKIAELDTAIARNDYRTANIRAGYVYVISNIGAFGPNMVKIGMTRRLEPMDRVRELGDASVPFPFDVHALYFSDDAVTLEMELHQVFRQRSVNQVNPRREFFFASPEQVRQVLAAKLGNLLEYTDVPEASQYNQSRTNWQNAD